MANDEPRPGRLSSARTTSPPRPEPPPDPDVASEESEWLDEWDRGDSRRTISFYHAEGAPYLDDNGKVHQEPPPEEMEDLRRRGLVVPPAILEEIVESVIPIRKPKKASAAALPASTGPSPPRSARAAPEEPRARESGQAFATLPEPPAPRQKPIDLSLAEELAYVALKKVFPDGLRIPIRKEGLADLDVTIKDKDIVIDVNRLFVSDVPRLSVWKITYAYQGEALVVYGRDVKGDIKVHPLRMARFLARIWLEKGRTKKQVLREAKR